MAYRFNLALISVCICLLFLYIVAAFDMSSSTDKGGKRKRTAVLRSLQTEANDRSLARILKKLEEYGWLREEAAGRDELKRLAESSSTSSMFCAEVLDLESGETFTWDLLEPSFLLNELVLTTPGVKTAFRAAWSKRPSSMENHWRCAFGFDEFSPGNPLSPENRRKIMVMSFTFLEFELATPNAWSTEQLWFPVLYFMLLPFEEHFHILGLGRLGADFDDFLPFEGRLQFSWISQGFRNKDAKPV